MAIQPDKTKRQQRILGLVRSRELSTQAELVELLDKAGYDVTQSSVSRDIEELGIIKVRGVYRAPDSETLPQLPSGARLLMRAGDNLIVLHCEPGFASALSVAIEQAEVPEIVGTIAGDDTIFIATDGRQAQTRAARALSDLFSLEYDKEIFG